MYKCYTLLYYSKLYSAMHVLYWKKDYVLYCIVLRPVNRESRLNGKSPRPNYSVLNCTAGTEPRIWKYRQ